MINMRTNSTNLKYILYARKSSESDERQVQSIDDQLNHLKSLAKEQGLKIIEIITEKKSAKDPFKRPEFSRMVERIEAGEANGILCWKYDRLTRNPLEGGQLRWFLQQGTIKSIWTSERNYSPEDNVLLLSIEDGMSNQYIRDLSNNVKRGMKSKREKGWYPHRAQRGYINSEKNGERVIIKDPDRFDMIQKMWEMILTENYSISDIEEMADKKWGFRTIKTKRMGGVKLTKARLYEMFSSPFYKGIYIKDGIEYKMNHPSMVSTEEWESVQYIIGRKTKPRNKKHNFTFRGPIFCGECGCLITAETKTKKIVSTGKLKKYTYYHCTRRKKDIGCSQNKSIREDVLESQILEELGKITINPRFTEWALEFLRGSHEVEIETRNSIFVNLKKTYKDIEMKLNRLLEMKLNNQLLNEEYSSKKQELLNEKSAIKRQIDNYDDRVDNWLELTERAFNFTTHARTAFIEGSPEDKRNILQTLGTNITLA